MVKRRLGVPLLAAISLVLTTLMVAPAQADTCSAGAVCPTTIFFGVNQGGLTVTVPNGPVPLGNGVPGETIVDDFVGFIDVVDNRAAAPSDWTAHVSATDFEGTGTPPEVINHSNLFYSSGPAVNPVGSGTFTPGQTTLPGEPLSNTITAFSHTGSGNNSVSWDPTLTVTIPFSAISDIYTATLFHSVG